MKGDPARARAGHSDYHLSRGKAAVVESVDDGGRVIFISQ